MNALKALICVFTRHRLNDMQERILWAEFLPGERWHTLCQRCQSPISVYIEPKYPDVYCLEEE